VRGLKRPASTEGAIKTMTSTQARTTRTNHYFRAKVALAALAVAASLLVGMSAKPAHASTTFTVNSTNDRGDGTCDASECTLTEAIEAANATPNSNGADVINFNIPGSGVHTIKPSGTGTPAITDRVTIDGYSQGSSTADTADDAKPNTAAVGTNAVLKIELDGTNEGSQSGLFIDTGGSGSVIRGLVINRFQNGIQAEDSTQNRIEGNFIGTDPSGSSDLGNRETGVNIFVTDPSINPITQNTVGGNSPDKRNLISGNGNVGVRINPVLGASTGFNRVEGNLIGTKKDGTSALGNGSGVQIAGSANNTVSGNTIAFSEADGIAILEDSRFTNGDGNILSGNSIFSNGELGIDLANNGVTANDADNPNTGQVDPDSDTGPNELQNFPVLSSAKTTKKGTTIAGTLNSTPNKSFIVQFFSNASGGDEGQKPIGQVGVTTDASGNTSFTFKPAQKVSKGKITATAIDSASKNTSEFSAAKKVVRKR
jgi:CSLREA domain-containing protein